jgi:dTDP-4-dehydrorhamnose 3,5-epimerase
VGWYGVERGGTHATLDPRRLRPGFLALEPDTEVLYKTTDIWAPEWERTVAWNDPRLAIPWPLPDGVVPLLSGKDANAGRLSEVETYP